MQVMLAMRVGRRKRKSFQHHELRLLCFLANPETVLRIYIRENHFSG